MSKHIDPVRISLTIIRFLGSVPFIILRTTHLAEHAVTKLVPVVSASLDVATGTDAELCAPPDVSPNLFLDTSRRADPGRS